MAQRNCGDSRRVPGRPACHQILAVSAIPQKTDALPNMNLGVGIQH